MGYLTNSGSGFLSNAVTTVSNVKSYLVNKTGYLVDSIRVGIGDFGQRVLDDGGTVEASAEAAASYREITKDIYDQASLVLFPSGYKDNLLYSHKPVDGSGDFTYSRGTDTATRVGADGYIKKERANLLEQSNQFDTTWNLSGGATLNQNAVGIDNIPNTAWTFTKDSTFDGIKQNISKSGINTFSVYAKKIDSGVNELVLRINVAGGNRVAIFDLSNGTKVSMTSDSSAVHYDIQKAGNGWYRCSFVVSGTIANVDIRMDYNQTGTGSMLVQNAQLEEGLVATSYIETTTAPVYEGLTDNLPRIDYTGGTPSILLEPSRINLVTHSEYFDDWITTEVTLTPNNETSPEGVSNAYSIIETTANNRHRIYKSIAKSASAIPYCFSVFVKNKSGSRNVRLNLESNIGGSKASVVFDTSGNVVSTASAIGSFTEAESFKEQVGDYWKYTLKAKSDTGTTLIPIFLINNGTTEVYTGDGTSGVYLFGAQLEEGSYPTSYIPTYNSSATRGVDFATKTGLTSSINSTEGTMFLDFKALANVLPSEYSYFSMSDGTYNNRISIVQSIGANNQVRVFAFVGGTKVFDMNGLITDITAQTKVALRYANNAFDLFINGAKVATDTSGAIFPANTLDRVSFSEIGTTAKPFKGKVNQTLVFPTALSDDDCEALTAL